MYAFIVLYGLFFIGLGFFVKKYPDTIAGYNTLSPRRKKQVDIDGLSACLKKVLIVSGCGVIVTSIPLWAFGLQQATTVSLVGIPGVILMTAAFRSRRFGLYKRK